MSCFLTSGCTYGVNSPFEIIGGEYDGHVIVKELHVHSSNGDAERRARAELSRICVAVRVMTPQDSSELHDIPMVINVGVDKRRNTILAYSPPRRQCAGETVSFAASEVDLDQIVRHCPIFKATSFVRELMQHRGSSS